MNIFNDDSNFVYILNEMGQKVMINNIEIQALISNQADKTIDYKKIKTIIAFKTGDIVIFQGYKWLITSEVTKTNTIYKAVMRKCNNTLRYKALVDGIEEVIEVNAVIDAGSISLDENKYINVADNSLICQVGYSELSKIKNIIAGLRFILNDTIWKCEGINPISSVLNTEQGIIIIKLASDVFVVEDNRNTGIAYNTPEIVITTPIGDNFTIEIPTSSTDIEQNKTFQITPICKNNGVAVATPIVTYISSNETIATIDASGLVTSIGVGTTIISVKFEDVETQLSINVTAIPVLASYKIVSSLTGTNYLTINNSSVRSQYLVNDDMSIPSGTWTFTLEQSDLNPTITPQQLVTTLAVISDTSVKLTASASAKGSFYVVANNGLSITKNLMRIKGVMDY